MPRVKRGKIATKKRKKILKHTKGFMWGRKSKERAAKEALLHAWSNMFKDRRLKKRDFRQLWQVKIKAGIESLGLKYNKFVKILKDNNVLIDRKILSQLAEKNPSVFKQIVEKFKK
jgi:large subunit ribosomal protein L20